MKQKPSLETDVKEQKGDVLYFPYSVPPGVPFFAEGGRAEEYPTVEDVRRRERELAVEARKRFCVYPKELSVAIYLIGIFFYDAMLPFYYTLSYRIKNAYYRGQYFYDVLVRFIRLFLHGIRISHLKYLTAREKEMSRREYLDMKLWHVDKKFQLSSGFNFYGAGEKNESDKAFYERVETYKEFEAEIEDVEKRLRAGGVDEDERQSLFLDAKEKHRLAYRQLILIEGAIAGWKQNFCDTLNKIAGELKDIAEALGAAEDEIKKEVEKQAPFLREKYGEGAVRVCKLLLEYDRQTLLWIWLRSRRDFFRFWSVVRFLENEKIIFVEHNQPLRFKDDLQSILHAMAEGWREGMEKQKASQKAKKFDDILHRPLSRKEITSIIMTGLFLNMFFSVTVTTLENMRERLITAGLSSIIMLLFFGCAAESVVRFFSWVMKAIKGKAQA